MACGGTLMWIGSGGWPIAPAGLPWWSGAAASASRVSGGSGIPLLTPLQSLKLPSCHSSMGRQKPYSEQHEAKLGQPALHCTCVERNGAAAQLPSPVPAPSRPACTGCRPACRRSRRKGRGRWRRGWGLLVLPLLLVFMALHCILCYLL